MLRVAESYFENRAEARDNTATERVLGAIHGRLSIALRDLMEALYTALQVKTAVFETSPSKVPGPDGFHAAFFGKEWHVVGPRITKVCLETLNGVSSIAPLNQKHIVLIPKNKTPRRMADY